MGLGNLAYAVSGTTTRTRTTTTTTTTRIIDDDVGEEPRKYC